MLGSVVGTSIVFSIVAVANCCVPAVACVTVVGRVTNAPSTGDIL